MKGLAFLSRDLLPFLTVQTVPVYEYSDGHPNDLNLLHFLKCCEFEDRRFITTFSFVAKRYEDISALCLSQDN